MSEIILQDDQSLLESLNCNHSFLYQANVNINGIIYDIYYCSKCLMHVKKERPCPLNLQDIK